MNTIKLKQIIREEIQNVLKEAVTLSVDGKSVTISSILVNKLKVAMDVRMRDPKDKNAHDEVQDLLMQIYKKAGRRDAKELAAGNMEDEVTMTGPVSAVVSLIKDTIQGSSKSSKSIDIKDALGRYIVAFITKTSTGSQIEKPGMWKYSYAGSPMDLLNALIQAKAVREISGKYRETGDDQISNAVKSNPEFKK